MKIGYFNKDIIEYKEFTGKIDIFVPCKPLRALFCVKSENNSWIVCDYLTGLKLGVYATKKAAKINAFTDEMSLMSQSGINLYEKRHKVKIPEVNKI